jgi:hypothetical protein
MKSNRATTSRPSSPKITNLHQTLSREKEALVTMFLASASHNELTEQIKKIDDLCSRIDSQHKRNPPHR